MPERQSQQAGTHVPLSSLPGREQARSESPRQDKTQLALGELPSYETGNPAPDIPPNAHAALECPLKVVPLSPLVGLSPQRCVLLGRASHIPQLLTEGYFLHLRRRGQEAS